MTFPSAWMGDEKPGYKCAVCRAQSHLARGGRAGHETSHTDYCFSLGILTDRVKKLEGAPCAGETPRKTHVNTCAILTSAETRLGPPRDSELSAACANCEKPFGEHRYAKEDGRGVLLWCHNEGDSLYEPLEPAQ